MLKPLDQADSQSAQFARNLCASSRTTWRRVLATVHPNVLNAPLAYSALRIGGMVEVESRLAELDTSEMARFNRCVKLAIRLTEITGRYVDTHSIYFF